MFEIKGSMFEYILIITVEKFCVLDGWEATNVFFFIALSREARQRDKAAIRIFLCRAKRDKAERSEA